MALHPLLGWTASSLLPGVSTSRITRMAPPPVSGPRDALIKAVFGHNASLPVVGSQTSPVSASTAPAIAKSVGQQNTGAQWNPFSVSGWVSPNQSGVSGAFGPYGNGGRSGKINNILSLGV